MGGELYPGEDPELNRELDQRQAMVAALNTIPYERREERSAAIKELLAEIGEETQIRCPFFCDFGDGIRIGARTFVNFNCVMLDGAPISVGNECLLASGVQLITATQPIDPVARAGVVAFGNPARAVREIGDRDRLGPPHSLFSFSLSRSCLRRFPPPGRQPEMPPRRRAESHPPAASRLHLDL